MCNDRVYSGFDLDTVTFTLEKLVRTIYQKVLVPDGYIVDLTFDLDTVTFTLEKLVRTISQKVLVPAASNLVCSFPVWGRCATSGYLVDLTFHLETVTLILDDLVW